MSKRKNTLNDLEEFLKLQASTLVQPKPVETIKPAELRKPVETVKEEPIPSPAALQEASILFEPAKAINLLDELEKLAIGNKDAFYDHIIKAAEAIPGSNDVLLINTALYLKHGDNWKSGIEEYWRKRKSS
jgi:hypothetical protein